MNVLLVTSVNIVGMLKHFMKLKEASLSQRNVHWNKDGFLTLQELRFVVRGVLRIINQKKDTTFIGGR